MKQTERVLEYLKEHGTITPKDASDDLSVMRLGARIFDLRARGVNIQTEYVNGKNKYGEPVRFARYRLEE